MLIDEDADIRAAIKGCVLQQPFKLICHRLLHLLDDNSLLDFLNNILGQSYSQRQLQQLVPTDMPLPDSPVGRGLWASQRLEQCLQLLVFGCVTWQELDSLSMNVALAFHYSQLQKAVEASDQHQVMLSMLGCHWHLAADCWLSCLLLLHMLPGCKSVGMWPIFQSGWPKV